MEKGWISLPPFWNRLTARMDVSRIVLASPMKERPSWVKATLLVERVNRRTPSSASRDWIWWVTAGWVTESCTAVFAKFRVYDKVRKQVSWNVFMGNPFYKIDKSFLSMITFFEFTCKPECV